MKLRRYTLHSVIILLWSLGWLAYWDWSNRGCYETPMSYIANVVNQWRKQ